MMSNNRANAEDNGSSEKPQLDQPDAPISNEELHLGVGGIAARNERVAWATQISIAAVAASLHGFIPAYYGVALPATFAVLHLFDNLGFLVNSDTWGRWLLNKLVSQPRSLKDVQQTHKKQLAENEAVADGGTEVTSDE
jgi:hypothetical protein